jgi:hypothetical protein
MSAIAQKCRLCGKQCTGAQGRGVHEKKCAKERGAKIVGNGAERHFLLSDGSTIASPNAKATAYNVLRQKRRKAMSMQLLNDPNTPKPKLGRPLGSVTGSKKRGTCPLCKKTVNILGLSGHMYGHVTNGEARWKNGVSTGPTKELIPTKLGHEKFGGASSEEHPSEITPPVPPPVVTIEEEPTPQERYNAEASVSHQALYTLQKATALMQFSVMLEEIGPIQAMTMLNGLSNVGKALNRRK